MDRIHYAGGNVLTGTAIAGAVLAYAEVLAKSNDSATLDIPTRQNDGSVGHAQLLLGPASELISASEDSDFAELEDEQLVRGLEADTQRALFRSQMAADSVVRASVAEPTDAPSALDIDFE